jgi:hypothetical protein
MSKKRPTPAEAKWRANYRYRRMLAARDGDPLFPVTAHDKALLAASILVTNRGSEAVSADWVNIARQRLKLMGLGADVQGYD